MLFQGPDDVAVLSKLPQPADNEELLDIEALREPSRGLRTALEHADHLRGQGRPQGLADTKGRACALVRLPPGLRSAIHLDDVATSSARLALLRPS